MKRLIDFLRLIRLPNLVVIALTQYAIRFGIIYPFLKQANLDLFMPESLFTLLVIATVFIAAAGYIINDYFDIKVDYVNKPDQLVVGKTIKRRTAIAFHMLFNLLGLTIAGYIAFIIGHPFLILFQLVSAALLWFYTVNFKKQFLTGNLIIAILTALVPFTAGYYEVAIMYDQLAYIQHDGFHYHSIISLLFSIKFLLYWIIGYSVFAFLLTLAREIVKDMEDIKGDKEYGCKTMPIIYGIKKTKNVALFILLLTLSAVATVETLQIISGDWLSFSYFISLISIPLIIMCFKLLRAKEKKDFFFVSQGIKITMLFGILYTIIIFLYH